MNEAKLDEITALARKAGYVYIATADGNSMPQVEKQLVITVEKILDFSLAPHCDVSA